MSASLLLHEEVAAAFPSVTGRRRPRTPAILEDSSGADLSPIIRDFQRASLAPNTQRALSSQWCTFTRWCEARNLVPLPALPSTVAQYIAEAAMIVSPLGGWYYAPGTLSSWLSSINKAHSLAGFPKPGTYNDVRIMMEGIRRERARPISQRAALVLDDVRRVLAAIDLTGRGGTIGQRDRALIVVGFAGAFRRSELAALTLEDLSLHEEDGLHIKVRRSKTDQRGLGQTKAVPRGGDPLTCAPCAYVRWASLVIAADDGAVLSPALETTPPEHVCFENGPPKRPAPFFRPVMKNGVIKARPITGSVVRDVVQRRVAAAGMNEKDYGAHSLRAGFVTEALRNGATHHEVMRQTGHTDPRTVEIYSRERSPLAHNAVLKIGL